jgi:hypothetical protein
LHTNNATWKIYFTCKEVHYKNFDQSWKNLKYRNSCLKFFPLEQHTSSFWENICSQLIVEGILDQTHFQCSNLFCLVQNAILQFQMCLQFQVLVEPMHIALESSNNPNIE